ncbi:MAG: DUF1564 domain-containing protein, partial [Leptospira sp.]|nr:DUF1564 domain-containing protein [Leptospira sp.]
GGTLTGVRSMLYSDLIPRCGKLKKQYQNKGQNLKRFCFRPHSIDWQELMLVSESTNNSASLIFVYLFLIEASQFGEAIRSVMKGTTPSMFNFPPYYISKVLNLMTGTLKIKSSFGNERYDVLNLSSMEFSQNIQPP